MPRPGRPKKKQQPPPIETSDNEPISTFSASPPPSPGPLGTGEKTGHQESQKPAKKTTKLIPFTAGIPSISFPPLSPKQHLQKALESLTRAYKGLEEEEEEEEEEEGKKELVKQLEDYTRSILAGENPFIKGKEKTKDILKGLVEEVKAL
jgi:hypothetical protein